MDDDHLNSGAGTIHDGSSLVGLSAKDSVVVDLPPPPPKPAEDATVQRIEVLCQFICKNGSYFEDMVRQKEFKNPKFEFLLGGEPGSEAAVAHRYFLWMKRKYNLDCESLEGHEQSNSFSRPSDFETPRQANRTTDVFELHSLCDSDVDMEDDMIEPDKSQGVDNSLEDQDQDFALARNNVKEQLHSQLSSAEHSPANDVLHGKVGSARLIEHGKGSENFANCDSSILGGSSSIVGDVVESLVFNAEFPEDSIKVPVDSNAPAAVADTGVDLGTFADPFVKEGNPFLLLQGYASDDSLENDDDPCLKDASPQRVSGSVTNDGVVNSQSDLGCNSEMVTQSKSPGGAQKGYESPESVMASPHSMLLKSVKSSSDAQRDVGNTVVVSSETENSDGIIHDSHEDHEPLDNGLCHAEDVLDHGVLEVLQGDISKKEEIKSTSCLLKIDEFGRVARDGTIDSDSDDSRYTRGHGKRERNWSRSRSPLNRRRRSPWRRKNTRSLSHSWSPQRRRSRSRSPLIRHGGNFRGDKISKDKIHGCFDFLRGRCYRGASCRFSHHQNREKDDESRRYRKRELFLEDPHHLKKSNFHRRTKNISVDKSFHERSEVRSHENQCPKQISDNSSLLPTENIGGKRGDDFQDEPEALAGHFPSQPATRVDIQNSSGETTENAVSFIQANADKQGEPHLSDQRLQNDDHQSLHMNVSSLSNSSPNDTAKIVPNQCTAVEPDSNKISLAQPYPGIGSTSLSFSFQASGPESSFPQSLPAIDFSYRPQLFPIPPPPHSQAVNPPYGPQPVRDHTMDPTTVNFPFQSVPAPYQAPLPNQQSQFTLPISSWTTLPPPPPQPAYADHSTINAATSISVISSEYQQNHVPPRHDFGSQSSVWSHPTEPLTHSQFAELTYRGYPPVPDPQFPMQVGVTLPYGGRGHTRKDQFLQFPVQGLNPPSSSSEDSLRPQNMPFSGETYAVEMQSIPCENLGPGGLSNSVSRHHDYLEQHRSPFSSQHLVAGSDALHAGALARYPDIDRSRSTYLADIGGSRFSAHHNPYASTFEHPLNSKFSSSVRQENNMLYGSKNYDSFGLSNVHVDGHKSGIFGSRQMASSPNSRGYMLKAIGDQYDPLFDSIEPTSSSLKKSHQSNHVQMQHSANNSGIMSRPNLYDKEENKLKEVGDVAGTMSLENDEFGETADAEVGAVENGSPSDPIDLEDTAGGEIEIDQFRSPGKSKDSRSMKLFKATLANFVKEVLKPSWRQGNMSKEAFKTIVKKTVDKVSGAMKGHRIPKSQAKIDHYIASSQRKLTKLVMGYVDKFVKV